MGAKGSAPNKSWFPFTLLIRRGVVAFGGGATKIEATLLKPDELVLSLSNLHNGGGEEWLV